MRTDERGLPLTTNNDAAVTHNNRTIRHYLEYRTATIEALQQTLAADPEFVMGHCLKGYLGMLACTTATHNDVRQSLDFVAVRCSGLTRREQTHLAALRAWFGGDLRTACGLWDDILVDHPTDLLALRLQHFATFWSGKSMALRDGIARAWHAWDEQTPGYSYVLGMYAFGLEEAGDYAAALLWRLEFQGVDVGDRWHELAQACERRLDDHVLAFTDLHVMVALVMAGRYQAAERLLASLRDFATTPDNFAASAMTPVTLPMCESILAYSQGAYQAAVAGLLPIRYDYACVGGSRAQRDVFALFLIEAALKAERWPLACALLAERVAVRPNSRGNWLKYAQTLDKIGETGRAEAARQRAAAVL
jgi:hypothetical protein